MLVVSLHNKVAMKLLGIFLFCLSLLACQHRPHAQESTPPLLQGWQMSGKFSFYHEETILGSFEWDRHPKHYTLRFQGPLSVGAAVLEGDASGVHFSNDKGDKAQGVSAEQLLDAHMGWHVPIEALPYWIQGRVVPGSKATVSHDQWGRLQVIEQLGWRVEISAYDSWHGRTMPKRFLFKRGNTWGKLVIKSWDWLAPSA